MIFAQIFENAKITVLTHSIQILRKEIIIKSKYVQSRLQQ